MDNALDIEVDGNFDALLSRLGRLIPEYSGQFALMRQREIVGYYQTESLALANGRSMFADGLFSVQEITDRPADLGFFSHAVHPRIA